MTPDDVVRTVCTHTQAQLEFKDDRIRKFETLINARSGGGDTKARSSSGSGGSSSSGGVAKSCQTLEQSHAVIRVLFDMLVTTRREVRCGGGGVAVVCFPVFDLPLFCVCVCSPRPPCFVSCRAHRSSSMKKPNKTQAKASGDLSQELEDACQHMAQLLEAAEKRAEAERRLCEERVTRVATEYEEKITGLIDSAAMSGLFFRPVGGGGGGAAAG